MTDPLLRDAGAGFVQKDDMWATVTKWVSEADGGVSLADNLDRAREAMTGVSAGLRAVLPPWFQETWLFGLERWQWLGLPLLLAVAFGAAMLLAGLSVRLLRRLVTHPRTAEEDVDTSGLTSPARLVWFATLGGAGVHLLALPPSVDGWLSAVFRVLVGLGFFWAVLRAVRGWSTRYAQSRQAVERPGSRALVNLVSQVLQMAAVAFAVLVVLSELGFSVGSVLAGLGIGGIALALGAQKTLEHLFGAFALTLDQPIREGDFVKVDDFVGTVEAIGLRSTRIRTLDRTRISLPNGKLAEMRLENYAARDRFRLNAMLLLAHGASPAQVRAARDGIERTLVTHSDIYPHDIVVRVAGIGPEGVTIELNCWFAVKNWAAFVVVREEALLGFMDAVQRAGARFAVPLRQVQLSGTDADGGPPPAPTAG